MNKSKRPSGNCPKCGIFREHLQRDHIIPRHKGGSNALENIQLICANCHEDKTCSEQSERLTGKPGKKHSLETREKIRMIKIGKKHSLETRAKIGIAFRGKKLSPEHRAKLSTARKGKHDGGMQGKKHSIEARAKMSAALIGKKFSPEHRSKLSTARQLLMARQYPDHFTELPSPPETLS